MTRSFKSLTPSEVLAVAIDLERRNASRYQQLARIFERRARDVHVLMKELADEELDHMDRLEVVWTRRFGTSAKPRVDISEFAELIEPVGPDPTDLSTLLDLDVSEAIAIVKRVEERAQSFFSAAADNAADPELASLFRELAELEQQHIMQVTVDSGDVVDLATVL